MLEKVVEILLRLTLAQRKREKGDLQGPLKAAVTMATVSNKQAPQQFEVRGLSDVTKM